MDIRTVLNDEGDLPPKTPKSGRQASAASVLSQTPSSTAPSQASKTSPVPQASPLLHRQATMRKEIPNWAKRFDWSSLTRTEPKQPTAVDNVPPPVQQTQSLSHALPKPIPVPPQEFSELEPSLTNIAPYDEITRQVCDFLWNNVVMREDLHGNNPYGANYGVKLEVEGKLGILVSKETNDRVSYPIASQAVLAIPPERLSFRSFMSEQQHKFLNDFLNKSLADSHKSNRPKMRYEHLREKDTFYHAEDADLAALPPSVQPYIYAKGHHRKPRVRITRDHVTHKMKARILKCRVADLDIHSPREPFDCRISVNIELEIPEEVSLLEAKDEVARLKDRLSYKHQHTQIDLTQVKKDDGIGEKVHELEVEIDTGALIHQGLLTMNNSPEACYEEVVKTFLSNIRLLSRAAKMER
ncbi:CYTH-like domain-containing protein [Phyllosticta citrichinensis]|uniref:mRNA-capping enzyme subunit beta n=1 Tax=Phyllosticta citrichinensis TaxID=1130410 RepID=A0ABR1Y062_9PEZI